MSRLNKIKEDVEKWVENSQDCEILSKKVIAHPIKKEMMTFNVIFSDRERNIKHTVIGFENEAGECCVILEVPIYTGIKEDIHDEKEISGYSMVIKNNGKGEEALVKLTKWIKDDILDFQKMMDIVVEEGINKLVYQFTAWNF